MQATFVQGDMQTIDYTPNAAKDPGSVQVLGTIVGVDVHGTAADELGALAKSGIFDVVKIGEHVFTAGDSVYWDATGDPIGGVAESGAATNSAEALAMGVCVETCAEDATTVRTQLQQYMVPTS